jgi:hypothetical protein
MNVLIFGTKGYLSNSLLYEKKRSFKVTLLSKSTLYKNKISDKKFDLIIHTLGANKFESKLNKKKTLKKKELTFKIINFAKRNKIKKIVYISSTNIYLKNKNLLNQNSSYVSGHIETEKILKKYSSKNMKILILRISHLFGLRDTSISKGKFLSIVNNFIQHSIKGKTFIVKNKNAEINILPISYLVFKLNNLLNFRQKYKIIGIGFLKIKIVSLIKIIYNRIFLKTKIKPQVQLVNGKYLHFEKINKPKINSAKLKIFIKEIDDAIKFFIKKYN